MKLKRPSKDKVITNLIEYITYIESRSKTGMTLYRGQNVDKPLLPKIGRLQLKNEFELSEEKIFSSFKLLSTPYISINPVDEWDWIALAQHHWLPTRLLDWTENPLIALWFAVNETPKAKEETEDSKDEKENGVIWIFDPQEEHFVTKEDKSPFGVSKTKVFQPKHITNRISAQSGWFTVHKYMGSKKKFIKMETNNLYKPHLDKLIIPPESFACLRESLDRCSINSATVFPDIDGLCKLIQWKNSYLEDEYIADL